MDLSGINKAVADFEFKHKGISELKKHWPMGYLPTLTNVLQRIGNSGNFSPFSAEAIEQEKVVDFVLTRAYNAHDTEKGEKMLRSSINFSLSEIGQIVIRFNITTPYVRTSYEYGQLAITRDFEGLTVVLQKVIADFITAFLPKDDE